MKNEAKHTPGPWDNEPDQLEWDSHGLKCKILRGPLGAWCGYVRVPLDHPLHGKGYSQDTTELAGFAESSQEPVGECPPYAALLSGRAQSPESSFAVHGGITFADRFIGDDEGWWFGFDCSHLGDLCPKYAGDLSLGRGTYRSADYAQLETERLARQLAAVPAHAKKVREAEAVRAAAPDLLAACERSVAAHNADGGVCRCGPCEEARAAITKAKGGEA